MKSRLEKTLWSYLPAVLGYVSVVVVGLHDLSSPQERLWAAFLLAGFGLSYFILENYPPLKRWNFFLEAFQAAMVTGLLIIQPGWSVFPILFFLMSAHVVFEYKIRTGLIWVTVYTFLTGLVFLLLQGLQGLVQLLPFAGGYFFFAVSGWYRVQAENERSQAQMLLVELQQAHQQLKQYTTQLEEFTIAQERNRIAREMHDTLGHRLTIASVQLEGAQRLIFTDPERVDKILSTVREQVKEGLGELRRTVAMLRTSVDEDLPLPQALDRLAHQVQDATGIPVNLAVAANLPELSAVYHQAFYRAAQEGLTNIQRHAKASQVWLQLNQTNGDIELLISDNGQGFSPEQANTGFGLTGLKERAALLGGHFNIAPRPGGGVQLSLTLPLEKHHES
jgi:signal transduction histidine kinase